METSYNDGRDRDDVCRALLGHRTADGAYSVRDLVEQGLVALGRPDLDADDVVASFVSALLAGKAIVPLEPTVAQVKASALSVRKYVKSVPEDERTRRWNTKPLSDGQRMWLVPRDEKAAVRYRAMVRGRPQVQVTQHERRVRSFG